MSKDKLPRFLVCDNPMVDKGLYVGEVFILVTRPEVYLIRVKYWEIFFQQEYEFERILPVLDYEKGIIKTAQHWYRAYLTALDKQP